ncbi:MAG TPA: ATP-binding protein [Bryobacteraceae bacterium]|jgi:signal transduction histidine kinase
MFVGIRRQPWLALVCGFGGLLFLMAGAEISALLILHSLRANEARLQQHFLERSRTLEEIRSSIYLSGTVARDLLLAPETGAHAQLHDLHNLHRKTDNALREYGKSREPEEAEAFASLRSEIDGYWKVLNGTFAWNSQDRDKYRYQFFYTELIPRRTAMLQIADRVGQLNEQTLQHGHQQLAQIFDRLQLGVILMTVVTLLGGAVLAVYTSYLILRLQGAVRHSLEENVAARASLRNLSAKMVRVQEEERRALSRELHDETGQSFSAILLEAENLLDMEHQAELLPHLASIRDLAQKGLREARNMALLLRPSMLDDFGLVPALNWQAKETMKRTGLRVQLSAADLPEDLPEEHKSCIYRIVQEALNNVARHAQACTVQISLQRDAEELTLSVQDDGTGFDAQRVRGLGLLGMEERVHHLGGVFAIDSRSGRGTLLKINLPLVTLSMESAMQAPA